MIHYFFLYKYLPNNTYMTILIGDRCAIKILYFSNKDRVKNYCNSFTSAQLYESGNCGIERRVNSIINLVQSKEQYCMLEIYSYPADSQ